jgi:hypothetical protein
MSDAIEPENQEDVQQRVASDEAISDAVSGEKSCPSVPGVIFKDYPEYGQLKSLMEAGIGAAASLKDRVLNPPDPEAAVNEAKDAVSDAATQESRAAAKAAKDIKDGAALIAANAKQAALDELDKVDKLIEAIGQGVIDIGTDLQNIDEITLNAMAVQFPGFKDARECLNGPADSGAAEANSQSAQEQITTPVPPNPASKKTEVVETSPADPIRSIQAGEEASTSLNEYPYAFTDPDDSNLVYAVYPKSGGFLTYNISSGSAKQVGLFSDDLDSINSKFPEDLNDLPVLKRPQYGLSDAEDAEDAVTELPE